MATLNFKEFEVPTDITGRGRRKGDARESFANSIYMNMSGIRAHALAMKIYRSEGDEDYSSEETAIITEAAEKYGFPPFIDGLREQLDKNNKQGREE